MRRPAPISTLVAVDCAQSPVQEILLGRCQDPLQRVPCLSQDCFESAEPILEPSDRSSYRNPHNLISFGPVLRMNNRILRKPVEGGSSGFSALLRLSLAEVSAQLLLL